MRKLRHGLKWQARIAALAVAVAVGLGVPPSAVAQGVAAPAAAPAASPAKAKAKKPKAAAPTPSGEDGADAGGAPTGKDPAAALAAYTAGVKAYQAGKFDAAVQSLDTAVNNGGLTPGQMPKALYYRGAAFQQLGKSGQAISDLTSALWFKPGLDDAERAEATKLRSAAYRDAGLDDAGQTVRAATGVADSGTAAALARTSPVPGESSPSSGLGGIGSAFGKLFGGGSSSTPPSAPASPPVAAVPSERAAASTAAPVGGEPEVLPWANRGSVNVPATGVDVPVDAAPSKPVKPKTVAPKAPAVAKPAGAPKAGGAVRIQVASVKSRDEASAAISKLKGMGGEIAAMTASVDETTFGASTFYRVQLGPFASAAATAQPCKALKAQGFDCLVMPN